MKIVLTKSKVLFDKNTHIYSLDGKKLTGVTPIVKWMYPETYKDIPNGVLKKAAEHGSIIHSKCELYDNTGIEDDNCQQLKDYIRLKKECNLQIVSNEYLVDDGKNIASSIDDVYLNPDKTFHLGDLKTTSVIHDENVTLQLSIYAWLFERCNPKKKVSKISVIWLPKAKYGEAKVMSLHRISSELCEKIVNSYVNGEESKPYLEQISREIGAISTSIDECEIPAEYKDVEDTIIKIEKEMKSMKEKEEQLRQGLLDIMIENNVKKWVGKNIQFIRKEPTIRVSVDSAKLKKLHPEVFSECQKISNVKESLTIKIG